MKKLSEQICLIYLIVFVSLILCGVVSAKTFTVNWSPSTPAPDGYNLYFKLKTDPDTEYKLAWSGEATQCSIDSTLPDNTNLSIPENKEVVMVVRSFNQCGESINSNILDICINTSTPPTGLNAIMQ